MSIIKKIAQSNELCVLEAHDNQYQSKIWFKTEPVDREFCYRVAQLQLTTDSRDQGFVDDRKAGSWSWFELAILPNAESTEPVTKDQRTLVWRSHSNRIGVNDMSRLFGVVFDRRGQLLDDLEPGNVIAVRVCARFPGWINNAERGELTAKILNEDLFSPQNWTLSSVKTPDIPTSLNNGVYTLSSTTECHVAAADNVLTSKIWFTSPALDEDVVAQIESIQLFTRSRNQNVVNDPDAGSWSWFDVVILDSPEATEPKINGGRSLAWSSHHNRLHDNSYTVHEGELFEGEHEMLRYLEAGNAIGVRICAQFDGWQNHAESGSLVVRISNIGPRDPPPYLPNVESFRQMGEQVQETITQLYQELAPSDLPPYESITTASLGIRIDEDSGVGKRPLRLLSLDGGGVRGISSLEVLKTVMKHVGENVKPCDYFDMIAGTSTGGLIAIMLGRLEMTVDECIEAYNALSKKIFSASSIVGQIKGAKYDANVLEEEIRKIVKKYGGDENATMLTKKENCKVFVVTVRADAVQKVVHSRTYSNPKAPSVYGDWKIWQAARATSAAPSYFEQIQIGDCAFVDGGLGFNNPVMELVKESFAVFGLARPIGCLLTIGTGITPDVSVGKATLIGGLDLAKAILAVATSCERAHETIEGIAPVFPEIGKDKYYRFNVGKDIAKWIQVAKDPKWYQLISKAQGKKVENWAQAIIEMDDYANMDRFVALTGTYLKNEETRVRECGLKLKGSKVAKA